MAAKIFLLEDDVTLGDTIADFLQEEGFALSRAYTGEEAEDILYAERFDLLLMDVNVPGINGFEILSELRARDIVTPAIYVTSLDGLDDLETGYASGADDYLRKPFALKELLLRIQTLLRRTFAAEHRQRVKLPGGATFDPVDSEVNKGGQSVALQPKELELLKLFIANPGSVVPHEKIYETLWGYDETPSESALRTYIKNLRKVIGKESIVSIKRYGYKYLPL